ncbi:hypothetical protein [Ralstonia sp. UBA689]|uniref:hypothetical protein n=1 Tax=Ralstonia sp. UBA689 TaxID=1947373 RepID=UPI0025EF8C1C|nr:hypothetical protein [Ralstonia sp. UBA689]
MNPVVNAYFARKRQRCRWADYIARILLVGVGVAMALLLLRTLTGAATPTLVSALAHCDRRLFAAIDGERDRLDDIAQVKRRSGSLSYIAVGDRLRSDSSAVRFLAPYQDGPLVLDGYFDEVEDLGAGDAIFTWGFLVRGSVSDVSRALGLNTLQAWSLHREGNAFVRTEVWDGSHWLFGAPDGGEDLPSDARVERILFMEETEPTGVASVRIGCSLQGHVSAPMLLSARPDL